MVKMNEENSEAMLSELREEENEPSAINSSDTDDSSIDSTEESVSDGECNRRRADCIENLVHLEKQFEILKELLFRERISQVEKELNDVKGGKSKEYLAPLQQLSENMNSRKEVAEILKKYRMDNIRHKFESEEISALQHFQSEKKMALDCIHEELMEKIRRLEEDRHNVDLSWDEWGNHSIRPTKVRGPGRKKVVTVSGPYIVYMLRDEDILDDWSVIRKAMSQQRDPYQNVQLIK